VGSGGGMADERGGVRGWFSGALALGDWGS